MDIWPVIRIVAFEFAGGDAFFLGLALLVTGGLAAVWRDGARVRACFRLATICSCLVIAASGTPLPLWFYGIGLSLIAVSLLPRPPALANVRARRRFRVVVLLLASWCAAGAVWEFSYRLPPRLDDTIHYDALVVIGDSVSAGVLGSTEWTWPKEFRKRHGVRVEDLSAEGATARLALSQARSLNEYGKNFRAVVVIEIGGNDYFELVPPADFESDLDRLLTTLATPDRRIIMLETPLPPFYNDYGRVERELATRHRVPLISKREFARVLFTSGATLDTVHLSEKGHGLFADMVWQQVGSLLRAHSVRQQDSGAEG
jgi:lysophospholipase L1-like esterase